MPIYLLTNVAKTQDVQLDGTLFLYNIYFKRVTPITMKSILPNGPPIISAKRTRPLL